MTISCNVVKDLIPLVNDGVASNDSKKLVNEHISECADCAKLLNEKVEVDIKDNQIIKSIKKNLIDFKLLFIGVGIFIAIFFCDINKAFLLNLLIIPLVSALPIIINKSRWLLMAAVYVVWPSVDYVIEYYFGYSDLTRPPISELSGNLIKYGAIYLGLAVLGIAAGFLLKFAFRREPERYGHKNEK